VKVVAFFVDVDGILAIHGLLVLMLRWVSVQLAPGLKIDSGSIEKA
jgi:hypothetical protein